MSKNNVNVPVEAEVIETEVLESESVIETVEAEVIKSKVKKPKVRKIKVLQRNDKHFPAVYTEEVIIETVETDEEILRHAHNLAIIEVL